jgi:hypothetical protein
VTEGTNSSKGALTVGEEAHTAKRGGVRTAKRERRCVRLGRWAHTDERGAHGKKGLPMHGMGEGARLTPKIPFVFFTNFCSF